MNLLCLLCRSTCPWRFADPSLVSMSQPLAATWQRPNDPICAITSTCKVRSVLHLKAWSSFPPTNSLLSSFLLNSSDLFGRSLKPGVRPIADTPVVCPADSRVVSLGRVEAQQAVLVKEMPYKLDSFLGCPLPAPVSGHDLFFAVFYLAPGKLGSWLCLGSLPGGSRVSVRKFIVPLFSRPS